MKDIPSSDRQSTALITGASSGIGRRLALEFARNGHNLVLVARTESRLEEVAAETREQFGVTADVVPKDLALDTAPQEIYDILHRKSVVIDILVNNAGFDVYGPFHKNDLTKELHMIQVNLVALTHLTKLFLRDMVDRKYGRILNLGSTGSFISSPYNAIYSATKAYVLSFSEAVAEELRGTGVTITTLCPGPTRSEFHARANMEDIRLMGMNVLEADHVAEVGYKALMAGKRVVVPGMLNKSQVILSRFTPRNIVTKTAKFMLEETE